jgi:hypothetical protein
MFNKKVIKYQFFEKKYSDKYVAEEMIKDIIVKATPTSSCWWSKLKTRLDGAKDALDEKKKIQEKFLSGIVVDDIKSGATAKTCTGIMNLFNKAYLVKAPTDIVITVDSNENCCWDIATSQLANIENHNKEQFWSKENTLFENKACFKIMIKIRLSMNGFGYILTEPFYHNTLNARFALGYVPSLYSKSEELNFFIFVDVPKEGTNTITIPKGTVLQYLIPDVKSRLVFEGKRFLADLLDTRFSRKRNS